MKKRNKERHDREWARAFHSEAFLEFTRDEPCVRCGGGPCVPHHEPTRASGGTWKNTSPLCEDCHTAGPNARHTVGVESFWTFGITYEQANRRHHGRWLAREVA